MSVGEHDRQRIQRALDDRLDDREREQFEADVLRDPQLRAAYVEQRWLHATLRAERDRLPQLLASDSHTAPRVAAAPRGRAWFVAAASLAAAACVALAWVYFRAPAREGESTVATIVQARNTKWAGSTLPTAEQSKLGPGTLSLLEGIATLRFDSGATVTLEAPTKLEIDSAMHCRLLEGSVMAEVPPSAHGFTIDTPDLKVVDLGTRFGVTAGAAGDSHVFVFDGEVRLDDRSGEEVRRLTEGKAFHVRSGAGTGHVEPRRFEPVEIVDGWTAIPTSFGRGQDTFVRRGHDKSFAAEPLLMVKHSEIEKSHRNERRAFLTFDLAEVQATRADVAEAELVLDPQPSGLGFSAMVPDSRFAVYGVVDESLDFWSDSALAWNNAPANLDAGPAAPATRRLAEFWIPRGGVGGPLTIKSPELAAFLREDTNGLVTFILVRETGETHSSGLVHAFASKEHPTARPPLLRVR